MFFNQLILKTKSSCQNLIIKIRKIYQQAEQGEFRLVAASLAYSSILAMIPFLAMCLALFKSIGGLEFLYPKIESMIIIYFREATGPQVAQLLHKTLQRLNPRTLGLGGFLLLFFPSYRLLKDMEYGINKLWHIKKSRSIYRQTGIQMLFLVMVPLILGGYGAFRSMSFVEPLMESKYQYFVDFIIAFGILYLVFLILPKTRVNRVSALWGAFASAVLAIVVIKGFSYLTLRIFSFSKIYGGLAALPIIFVWALWMWYVILFGAALTASLQKEV